MSYDPAALAAPSHAAIDLVAGLLNARPRIEAARDTLSDFIKGSSSRPVADVAAAASRDALAGVALVSRELPAASQPGSGVAPQVLAGSYGMVSFVNKGVNTLIKGTDQQALTSAWESFSAAGRSLDFALDKATRMVYPEHGSTLGAPA